MSGEAIGFGDRGRAVLQLNAVPGLEMPRLCAVFDRLAATGMDVGELLSCPMDELVSRFGFTPQQAEAFHCAHGLPGIEDARSCGEDLHLVTRADGSWPTNLIRDSARIATPWLFVLGDPGILATPGVGIVGARDATATSEAIAGRLASEVVSRGRVVVSGGARGIDRAAHDAAIASGGRTVVVLAQGVSTFRPPWHWRQFIWSGQLAVVSEYVPSDEWESFRAIQRNATIAQISDALIVVQSGVSGGTFSAGRAALRMRWPLHVVRHVGAGGETMEGNEALIRLGGLPLGVPVNGPLPVSVMEQVLDTTAVAPPATTQLGLFG